MLYLANAKEYQKQNARPRAQRSTRKATSTTATSQNDFRQIVCFIARGNLRLLLDGEVAGTFVWKHVERLHYSKADVANTSHETSADSFPLVPVTHRIDKSNFYVCNAAHRACTESNVPFTVHNVAKALREFPECREQMKQLRRNLANAIAQRDKAHADNDHLREALSDKTAQIKLLQQVKRRQTATLERLNERLKTQDKFWESEETQRGIVHQWVIRHIQYEDVQTGKPKYELFKQKFSNFSQHCRSLRRTAGAAHVLFDAIGLDPQKIDIPARATTTTFKIIEAEAGL